MALNYVTVTGTFNDGSGNPIPFTGQTAYCLFTPSTQVYASGIPLIAPAQPIQAPILNGSLTGETGGALKLLATDNAGLTYGGLTGFFFWTVQVVINGQAQAPWSFFLPHTPTTVDLSALANTAAGSSGFQNPMTTLGDLMYENATPAAARLAGNTTAAKQFLTQTGTGSVSAAPAWGPIQAADIPVVYQPWQFQPESYGAKGNGIVFTVNTNGTTTITATSAVFTSTAVDGGKYIMIHGANGAANGPLLTTISTVTDSTHAVLAAAPSATVSACPAVFGTDDVAAINSCISAAKTYALANGYFAEILFGPKIYILGSGPTQQTTPAQYSTQILIPYPDLAGATQKLVIQLTGAGDAGYTQFWESLIPNVSGTALVSMLDPSAAAANSATFGRMSVVGGPSAGGTFTGGFANTKVIVRNMSVWCHIWTNLYAWDFAYLSAMRVQQSSAHIFAPTGVNASAVQPFLNNITATALLNSVGSGFRTPVGGNNDDITMDDVAVQGYEQGFAVFDHFNAGRLAGIYCDVVLKWDSTLGSSTQHGLFIQSMSAEGYNGGLRTNGGACQVDINWDAENSAVPSYDVFDGGNLYGYFRFGDKVDNRAPIINGAGNLKVINLNLGPGYWSGAPAAPASTVSQQNTAWRDAWITLSATTGITVITVDGQTTGLTAGSAVATMIRVPAGKSYAVTYTGTLTTKWWLD